MNQRDRIVANRLGVELSTDESVRSEEKTRDRELNRVLEIPALRLEVMLRQAHTFVPDYPRKLLHVGSSFDRFAAASREWRTTSHGTRSGAPAPAGCRRGYTGPSLPGWTSLARVSRWALTYPPRVADDKH